MAEVSAPHTPGPEAMRYPEQASAINTINAEKNSKLNATSSSPLLESIAMTPPPSTQVPRASTRSAQAKPFSRREYPLASPPVTLEVGPPITSGALFGEVPTMDAIRDMNEQQLRSLVGELLPALGEARITAAHSKLQHSLLSIETTESAKRAAVEHEATRREVQVLQEGSPGNRYSLNPRSPQASVQRNLQLALAHCRDLQDENALLEKRLRSSKKIITRLDDENADLKEHVQLLRQRIKENRDHLNEMQSSGTLSINNSPFIEYSTPLQKNTPRTPATASRPTVDASTAQGSIDALLIAGQVLNGEANSDPSTPNQSRSRKLQPHHMRGAHSLSSLPTTPRSRPVTADNYLLTPVDHKVVGNRVSFSAPGTQLGLHEESRARDDRDSTISASDNEDDLSQNGNVRGSQASQVAADMLRNSLGSAKQDHHLSNQTTDSSHLLQTKLLGQVKKPSLGRSHPSLKRGADSGSYDEIMRDSKKGRVATSGDEQIGLGIRSWDDPNH